jgi:hypothetical protein
MKLKIRNGVIYTPEGKAVGVLSENADELITDSIEMGTELIDVVEEFIDQVNSGKLRPRSTVKKFENVIQKYE